MVMVKEEEEEKKFKVPHGVKNQVFPTVAWWAVLRGPAGMGEASRDSVPLFAKLVKVVFPVPAGSSKSEQVFSVASNVVTPNKRANLNPEKMEDLVVVKCNLRLLKSTGIPDICHESQKIVNFLCIL